MPTRRRTCAPRRRLAAHARSVLCCAGVAAGSVALSACDPCAGVAACTEAPRLGISGEIVDRGTPTDADRDALSGAQIPQVQPVAGVRVEVIPTAGVTIDAPRAVATTDNTGWWQVSMPASQEGDAMVDVLVAAPGSAGYAVRGVTVRASRTRGQGNVLGRWTRDLYLTLVGELYDAATGRPVDGARVTAARRSGPELQPTANTRTPMVTFGGGRFVYDMRPLADAPLVLDFAVERDRLPAATVPNVTVYPQHEWLPPNVTGSLVFVIDSAGRRVAR